MQNADVVLKGAKYLDVHRRKFVKGDIAIKDGKIVKQQKLTQGHDVYITENQFENNNEPLSAVVVESGKKHQVVFKYGDTLIEPSIRID